MFFHCLAPRDPGEKLLDALKNEDLPEVDRLIDLKKNSANRQIPRVDLDKNLAEACRAGLESCVVKWIYSTSNLDPETCQTLLRPAIVSGSIKTVEALLNRGADLNLPCSCLNSVLVVALTCLKKPDLMKMVKFLVEKGAYVNKSFRSESPLLTALTKQPDVVPYLLQNGADVNEAGDIFGNTPLIAVLCCYSDCKSSTHRCSIVKTLLSAGADPNKPNKNGETALHLARDAEIASLLIQAGADLEARNGLGRTPLLSAACKEHTDVINVLKNYGAEVAAVDNEGNSALHLKVFPFKEPKEETLRLFAFQCNQRNKDGETPLILAARSCQTKSVRILLELGADPNIVTYKSGEPQTALSFLIKQFNRNYEKFDLADAEELFTNSGVTSLPRCCPHFFSMIERDQRRLVQLMVKHGMVPLCENVEVISQISYDPIVRLHGISDKLSPLAFAVVSNRLAIAQYLKENWFLTPADLVGSMELRHLRSKLERESQADSLKFMDENLSQPMSLEKLSFVAVSAQLGGVAGREERVSQTPLPNILKDMLLFRLENFPMDFTDWCPFTDDESDEFEGLSDSDYPDYSSLDDEDDELEGTSDYHSPDYSSDSDETFVTDH
ncbi:ankyrin repeat protein [Plakobranchus ocellatus]|uniref:Ankyrin repeat protein n=1 Tax=Plakobranchus ocellatus TaxID=259542 RepID=A0AAV3YT06_9GAST|nr:ankyrin repeat protein [Plakobranchus ocellatus]